MGKPENGNFCKDCEKRLWICPSCQWKNGGGKLCQNCGASRPAVMMDSCQCKNCGWHPDSGQSSPKFCPECGAPLF